MPTGGTHTLQERYSSLVLAKLRKTQVFRNLFNTRYEGTPTAGAVKIPVRDTEVAVGDYNIGTGGTLNKGATTYETLNIDKDKYVNELIDGYEAAAVPDNLVADRLDSAGYAMGIQFDSDLVAALEDGGTAKTEAALTPETIYGDIVDKVQSLKKLGLSADEMWLAVTNETYGLLLKSPEFIKASALGDSVVQNGMVGRIAGVNVYETNNISTADVEYILGNRIYCHFVDEWMVQVAVNDLKDGAHIGASALQGRRVYGIKISKANTVLVKKKSE